MDHRHASAHRIDLVVYPGFKALEAIGPMSVFDYANVHLRARGQSDGYEVRVHPAWADYPTRDVVADTARMNAELQTWIDAMPEQYYWVHKRFKTRPAGEPPVY